MSQLTINKTNTTGIEDIDVEKPVYNGRGESLSLDRNGRYLLKNANFDGINFLDHDEICTKYYKALEAFALNNIPNVHKVFFDCNICLECYLSHLQAKCVGHFVRSPKTKLTNNPIYFVHSDFTVCSTASKFRLTTKQPRGSDTWGKHDNPGPLFSEEEIEHYLKRGRYLVLNAWKSFGEVPVKDSPLAVVDSSTVDESDLVTVEYRYQDGTGVVGEVYQVGKCVC